MRIQSPPGFLTLFLWTRHFAGFSLILLGLSPVGCDSSETSTGSIVQRSGHQLPITSLENDPIAKQELARIEFKLRDLNTISQADGLVLEGLRKKYPDNDRILNCLLQIYDHLNDWNATADLLKTFPGGDQNPKQANALGTALIKTGRFEEAKTVFANLCLTLPHQDSISHSYALCLFHTGDMEQAANELDKLVEVAGGEYLYQAFSLRGLVAIQQQDFAKAKIAFQKTLDLAPNDPTALLSMSRIMLQAGDPESAAEYELKAQVLRNDFNREKNAGIVGGTMTEAIRRAMRNQDFAEARTLIDRQMPLADEKLQRELGGYLYLIQEAEVRNASGPKKESVVPDKLH